MPAKSEDQQQLAAITLAYKRGEGPKPTNTGMMNMSIDELEKFASSVKKEDYVVDTVARMITDDPNIITN